MDSHHLQFIRHKLKRMTHAILRNLSVHPLRWPDDIIQFLEIDTHGQLWFSAHRPRQCINTLEHSFPARVLLYQKGLDYYIESSGVMSIPSDETDIVPSVTVSDELVMMKMVPRFLTVTEKKGVKRRRILLQPYYHYAGTGADKKMLNNYK